MNLTWQAVMDIAVLVGKYLLSITGVVALYFAAANWITSRRAHLLTVYKETFFILDSPPIQEARSFYTYGFLKDDSRNAFNTERWHKLASCKDNPNYATWVANRRNAEVTLRAFDQLGLLVREGRIPVNIVARFYVSPALRCWYALAPYIEKERSVRNQPGHMWEFEHLISDVIIPGLESNKGIWKGVSRHDKLEDVVHRVKMEPPVCSGMPTFLPLCAFGR